MDRLDFAVQGAHGLAVHYHNTYSMTAVSLATEVAGTLSQPFLCIDCETYQPLSTIVTLGIQCPKGGGYGHRVPNDVLQSILDVRARQIAEAGYPVKPLPVEK